MSGSPTSNAKSVWRGSSITSIGPSQTAATDRGSPIATNGGKRNSSRESQHFAITSGPIPAGSPSETASGLGGVADINVALIGNLRSAEFDHRVASKIRKISPCAHVHPLFVELAVDVVIGRRVCLRFVPAADDQNTNALLERAERLGGLADLHRQHHLLESDWQVAHLHLVARYDLSVEIARDLLGTAASADILGGIGKAGDDWFSLLPARALRERDRHLLEAENRVPRICRQDLARILHGDDRNSALYRDRFADRSWTHLPEGGGERRR